MENIYQIETERNDIVCIHTGVQSMFNQFTVNIIHVLVFDHTFSS